ncbi:flagellar protein FlaG [Solibacillus sp.]|uniref:flagellar protein FlaG n=1 Tax=Solibacillus sp. TaxID=1909654 RepID=UPI003314C0C9
MRITGNQNLDMASVSKAMTPPISTQSTVKAVQQGSETPKSAVKVSNGPTVSSLDNNEETKAKLQEAVSMMNEILETNDNTSRFQYHEGLDRYYVTVVDKNTDEVVKEIPPKKLLDAFYEMQKMIGMIVDEKI